MFDFDQMVHKTVTRITITGLYLGIGIFSLLSVCTADVSVPAPAPALRPPGGDKIPSSFVKYQPQTEEFPSEVRPVVALMNSASSITDDKNPQRQEKYQQALQEADKLLTTLPRGYHDELFFLRGLIDEELSNQGDALNDYAKSLSLRASNSTALFRRSAILENQKKYTEAAIGYREVVWRTHSTSYESLYALGNCYQQLGDSVKAIRAWEKAYAANTSYTPLLRQIIALRKDMIATAKTPEDKAKYQQQLYASMAQLNASDPNDPESALSYAQMLLDHADNLVNRGNVQRAEQIARGIANSSQFSNSGAVRILATSLIKQRKFEESAQVLEKGLKAKPNEATLLSAQQQLQVERAVQEATTASQTSS